jgi:hypothetical protein
MIVYTKKLPPETVVLLRELGGAGRTAFRHLRRRGVHVEKFSGEGREERAGRGSAARNPPKPTKYCITNPLLHISYLVSRAAEAPLRIGPSLATSERSGESGVSRGRSGARRSA